MPIALIYLCAAMLFIGAAPLPYDYYMVLRIVACGVFGFAAFIAFNRKCKALVLLFGILSVLFNPFIKVHFPTEVWNLVDIAAGIVLLVAAKTVSTKA